MPTWYIYVAIGIFAFWGQLFPNRQALYLIETLKSIFYKHLLGETVPFHVQYF